MPEKALLIETLSQIHGATERILRRFEPIHSPDDFLADEAGHEKLDAICMQLIAIGESLKNIDKITDKKLLPN
ncbi:MAG: antitoxin, partial [Sulfuricurvum sp.]|nr:antitoxin [Sulfuricurvum sp.]